MWKIERVFFSRSFEVFFLEYLAQMRYRSLLRVDFGVETIRNLITLVEILNNIILRNKSQESARV